METAGIIVLIIFLLLIAAAIGWVVFTRMRASRLGVSATIPDPPPTRHATAWPRHRLLSILLTRRSRMRLCLVGGSGLERTAKANQSSPAPTPDVQLLHPLREVISGQPIRPSAACAGRCPRMDQ